ncbi:MAG TPA: PLP-dependent aminotransferase family protein [Salinisphaeraceae bacterium]|nr:PLP-dependent aminotransferase family protein [Salinisphaeraceae bacterium]
MHRYEQVAQAMRERVAHGVYRVGDRLPSIRELCREFGISVTTAQTAYGRLEDEGLIEARPKSGYYLLPRNRPLQLPEVPRPAQRPLDVSQWDQVLAIIDRPLSPQVLSLAQGTPDLAAPSLRPLMRPLSSNQRQHGDRRLLDYDRLAGDHELRRQLVRVVASSGCFLHPDEMLVTTGCQEALSIALRAVTQPGDMVATDSPSFYGLIQLLQAHELKVMEIPTDAETGISLDALELALEQWPIRAVQLTPTCNNPLGYTMPERHKRRLLSLARRFDVPIIEDDVYGELAFDLPRPKTIKAFDEEGRVLLCSSVSKTLAPSLRIGWLAPGRYRSRAMHLKYATTGTTATLPQLAVADFIARGHYDAHVRTMLGQYRRNRDRMLQWVKRYFPAGTISSQPRGGFVLWLQLPARVDCEQLNQRLQQVSIAPGALFSTAKKYPHCLRLNYAGVMDQKVEAAVKSIGEEAAMMVAQEQVERAAAR